MRPEASILHTRRTFIGGATALTFVSNRAEAQNVQWPQSVHYTDHYFRTNVVEASYSHPVIADFWAHWCPPCIRVHTFFDTLFRNDLNEGVGLLEIDVDLNQQLRERFHVTALPTALIFESSEETSRHTGVSDIMGGALRLVGERSG